MIMITNKSCCSNEIQHRIKGACERHCPVQMSTNVNLCNHSLRKLVVDILYASGGTGDISVRTNAKKNAMAWEEYRL